MLEMNSCSQVAFLTYVFMCIKTTLGLGLMCENYKFEKQNIIILHLFIVINLFPHILTWFP